MAELPAERPGRPTALFVIGPPAVGKMTVGQHLSAFSGWPLFCNHRLIDLITDFLPYGTTHFQAVAQAFNEAFFRANAEAGVSLIATWGWRFDLERDTTAIRGYMQPYRTSTEAAYS